MRRRTLLKHTGIGLSVAGVTGLAGCMGGGGGGPFSASTDGPYVMEREYQENLVYVTLTLDGNPDEWPEFSVLGTTYRGYLPKLSEGEDGNVEDATILYEDDSLGWTTTESWVFEKSEFQNDQTETERVVLGKESELESGTEFVLYVEDPEAGKTHELASVTYEGDAEARTPTADA